MAAADNDQILLALGKLGQFMRALLQRDATRVRLSPTQIRIVQEVARRGPLGVSALAEQLCVSPPTISDAATALERKGLIRRTADADDGRASVIALTTAGAALIGDPAAMASPLGKAIGSLSAEEAAGLQRALVKVVRSLQEQRAIPVQRMCVTCAHFRRDAHVDPLKPHHCQFVDAAFGDASLRLECDDHVTAGHAAVG